MNEKEFNSIIKNSLNPLRAKKTFLRKKMDQTVQFRIINPRLKFVKYALNMKTSTPTFTLYGKKLTLISIKKLD